MSFTFRGSGAGLPHHVCFRVSHTCCHAWRHRHLGATESPQHRHRGLQRHSIIRRGFGDDLLDFIEAGPKLRKWYGEGERMPKDGGGPLDDCNIETPLQNDTEVPQTAVLVTDADSPLAEQVVLQLILAREEVKVLVKSVASATAAFGTYVTPCAGTTGNVQAVQSALSGAKAVVCTGRLGDVPQAAERQQLQHLIVVTSAGSSSGGFSLDSIMDGEAAAQRDRGREEAVSRCSVPHTIVRVGRIRDAPGGQQAVSVSQGDSSALGDICREDLAKVLVDCLQHPPKTARVFSVQNSQTGDPSQDLARQISMLQEALPV